MITLLIDNYDSFTWNVYQSLSNLGADVIVCRNDKISLAEAISFNPRNLVISPGPGHPIEAGISNDLIRYFAGKIPILGICLGEQCIFSIYGGTVDKCGEIVHGKTTRINHDGNGLYEGVKQRIECTRYHSLAGKRESLPATLVVTSETDSGIIMGVRHTEFVMEGVQFHPESIASQEGDRIFSNFLQWKGGKWLNFSKDASLVVKISEMPVYAEKSTRAIHPSMLCTMTSTSRTLAPNVQLSILQEIKAQRIIDLQAQQIFPGQSLDDLKRCLELNLAPKVLDFPSRLMASISKNGLAVLGEIKRASPSKGDLAIHAHAASLALEYACGGAATISVLTEPKWFKGSTQDMVQVRTVLESLQDRPCVLCKDFIVSEYHLLLARLSGADTILLIVAILSQESLSSLIRLSRNLGMEPLVEVASRLEMDRAISAGSMVIGINNRDLNTFDVDMSRASNLAAGVPADIILLALSGISSREDIEPFQKAGIKGILVGQSLMESPHPRSRIQSFFGPILKFCGVTSILDADLCAQASHVGLIFAHSSARRVENLQYHHLCSHIHCKRPGQKIVGVFMNQSVEFINSITEIDIIQLHSPLTPFEMMQLKKPIWYVLNIGLESCVDSLVAEIKAVSTHVDLFLVDIAKDSGRSISSPENIAILNGLSDFGYDFIVAGGIDPANCKSFNRFAGIDVCSGIEGDVKGSKDGSKIERIIEQYRRSWQ